MKLSLFLFLLLQVILVCFAYQVPQPRIHPLHHRGFRVSIPHENGVELFAFHGNINRQMNGLEAGQFSEDVLDRRNNRWVYEDHSSTLRPGDTIYYWLYVKKNGLGYRLDNGVYHVTGSSWPPERHDGSSEESWRN